MEFIAIILARGGSKGIPQKNIINFCGKPLIAWTIEHCFDGGISSIYVSSDSDEILLIAEKYGATSIKRPPDISGDVATSESGWLHALEVIEMEYENVDWVIAPQITSPLRQKNDIKRGLKIAKLGNYDSLFSCSINNGDLFFWERLSGKLESVNYDWKNRKRRQLMSKQYIENGSFYIFRPGILKKCKNRFGGRIGMIEMELWQMFEIDTTNDLKICSSLMETFIIEQTT